MNRTVIRFNPNAPVTVKLDRGSEGKETRSQINDELQWMYVCNDNANLIYLTAAARTQLQRTNAQAGDNVRITKLVDGKSVSWRVEVLSDASDARVDYSDTLRESIRQVPNRTNGATALAAQPSSAPYQAGSHIALCLCRAIDAAIEASDYARSKNFSVTFLGSDIRAMAATLYIEHNNRQNGGRN